MLSAQEYQMIVDMRQSNLREAEKQGSYDAYRHVRIEERSISNYSCSIPLRIYIPDFPQGVSHPVFISMHGGGFVMARAWMDDPFCCRIAAEASCIVVNIDYRLAPEAPYPAALEDVLAGYRWVLSHADELHADPDKIAIGGYSAGGNLAAAACIALARETDHVPCCQVLCYAPLDLRKEAGDDEGSRMISRLFNTSYVQPPYRADDPLVSPVCIENDIHLPAALIIAAGKDALMQDSAAYKSNLEQHGVAVSYHVFEESGHGFTHDLYSKQADLAWNMICRYLSDHFIDHRR